MAEIGALIVGIGAYRYTRRDQFPPLSFASTDADAVERYVRACWPTNDQAQIVRVPEDQATRAGVAAGFGKLAAGGPYELQLIFFSGHGLVDAAHAGLLVQPEPGEDAYRLVEAAALDTLIGGTNATRTVAILDCCFAEGIVRRMRFFAGLGGDMARLYVASSRETQRTWEDDRAGHGIFTAHLLDLLNTGSSARLSGVRDWLDVDGELFPILCEQVPLYVYANKTEVQEPVKGGVSSAPVTLPVARAARRLRERTALGTALRRVRQIGAGVLGAAAALLLFAYTMLYYVEPDSDGSLSVRRGTRWLEPVFRFLPTTRVDTGIGADALSSNPAASRSLAGGYSTGVWTHRTKAGFRAWYDTVAAGLDEWTARRLAVLIGSDEASAPQLDAQARPGDIAFASWAALGTGRADRLSVVLQQIPVDDVGGAALSTFNPNLLDFNILDRSADDMETFAQALSFAAALDPERTLPTYIGFLKGAQSWLTHNSDAQRGRDAREHVRNAVADVLGVIARARGDRGLPLLDPASAQLFEALARQGFEELVDTALSRIPGWTAVTERALKAFRGDTLDPEQLRALDTIKRGLDGSASARALCDAVLARFEAAGNGSNVYRTGFLVEAGDKRSLSAGVLDRMLDDAQIALRRPEPDYEDVELARILAHGFGQIPPARREGAYLLIDFILANSLPRAQASAEMMAALGKQGLDRPDMLAKVSEQAHQAPVFAPASTDSGSLPGMTIVIGYGPWLAALAQFGRTRKLDPRDVDLLRAHLPDPTLQALIVQALKAQEVDDETQEWPERWAEELGRFPTRADLRAYRQSIMTAKLAAVPRRTFLQTIAQLRTLRDKEREPETRIALGGIIADAPYWRVRPPEPGHALFD